MVLRSVAWGARGFTVSCVGCVRFYSLHCRFSASTRLLCVPIHPNSTFSGKKKLKTVSTTTNDLIRRNNCVFAIEKRMLLVICYQYELIASSTLMQIRGVRFYMGFFDLQANFQKRKKESLKCPYPFFLTRLLLSPLPSITSTCGPSSPHFPDILEPAPYLPFLALLAHSHHFIPLCDGTDRANFSLSFYFFYIFFWRRVEWSFDLVKPVDICNSDNF